MKTILIVDDNQQNLYMLQALFEGNGYGVMAALNGSEALKLACSSPPDIVISDILMPVMDGFAFCREWQADKHLHTIPFVFYTATYTDPKDEELALGLGAVRFILKPKEPDWLLNMIQDVLQNNTASELRPYSLMPAKDEIYLKEYNERLIQKLEKKMVALEKEIADRKKIEQALRESEEKYRLLFENAQEAIFVVQDEKFKFLNPKAEELLGVSLEQIKRKSFSEFIHPKDRELVYKRYQQRIHGEKVTNISSFRIVSEKGSMIWLHLNSVCIDWKGKLATLNFARDVTQEKNLEIQLRHSQTMEAIGTLAGGIAHDFNNILTAIIGYSEMARARLPATDNIDQDLEKVILAGKRAAELVEQILTFSRQEGEHFKPLKIQFVIKEVLKLLRASIPSTIELKENVSQESGYILADPTQLHQVLMNLCTNAKQAIADEVGTLSVSLSEVHVSEHEKIDDCLELPSGSYLNVKVSDTGCGMDDETKAQIFDPFFTTKEKGEGTGLGLSVVHGIIKQHKGEITVSSKPGKGTTFHIYIPLIKNGSLSETKDEVIEKNIPSGRGEKILFVDDESEIVEMMESMLSILGYVTVVYSSSVKAFESFIENSGSFDLLITDMTMPEMTGIELAKKILVLQPDFPIILCSGFNESVDEAKAKSIGIQEFLGKPVSMEVLAKTIRKVLDYDNSIG